MSGDGYWKGQSDGFLEGLTSNTPTILNRTQYQTLVVPDKKMKQSFDLLFKRYGNLKHNADLDEAKKNAILEVFVKGEHSLIQKLIKDGVLSQETYDKYYATTRATITKNAEEMKLEGFKMSDEHKDLCSKFKSGKL